MIRTTRPFASDRTFPSTFTARCGLESGFLCYGHDFGVVVVAREGQEAAEHPDRKVLAVHTSDAPDFQHLSSTKLRNALRNGLGDFVKDMLPIGACEEAYNKAFVRAKERSSSWLHSRTKNISTRKCPPKHNDSI